MNLEEIVPIRIIHFDPVRREIVKKESELWENCLTYNPPPQYFDVGYVYAPYFPVQVKHD